MFADNDFLISLNIVILWLGVWGISDTIINNYIPYDDNATRIYLYILILVIGFMMYYFIVKNNPSSIEKLLLRKILKEQEKLTLSVNDMIKRNR